MNPKHSISFCPICGGGLCGIRFCTGPAQKLAGPAQKLAGPARKHAGPDQITGDQAIDSFDEYLIDDDPMSDPPSRRNGSAPHGLIVCDECEAIWLSPDTETEHVYPDPEDAHCPICHDALWGQSSHWASMLEIRQLGWERNVDSNLDFSTDEGIA